MGTTPTCRPDDVARRSIVSRVLDAAATSHVRALFLLGLIALLCLLPGWYRLPVVDRDEPRFAQAAKQMVESGDYVTIWFQDTPRLKKPVGIYWFQSAAVHVGKRIGLSEPLTTIWLYRLPSLLGAIGAVWLTYWTALALVSRRAAVLAGLLLASCVLLGVEARLATTDAVLLMTTVAAMGGVARVYLQSHGRAQSAWYGRASAGIVWTAVSLGVLVKGPVILMVVALCCATLAVRDRSLHWMRGFRPLVGMAWLLALTLPWWLAFEARSPEAFLASSAADILPRVLNSVEGHGAPPGYYLLLFWVTFWPGSAFAGLVVASVVASRHTATTAFLLAWLVPSWVALELVLTKLPHYVLPLYPAVAILMAEVVDTGRLSRRSWLMWGSLWVAVVPLLAGAACVVGLILLGGASGNAPSVWLTSTLITGAIGAALCGWRRSRSREVPPFILDVSVASVLLALAGYGVVLPQLTHLFPSTALVTAMRAQGCAHPRAVTSPAYAEPSLVFLAGTDTRAVDVPEAVAHLAGGACRFAFVDVADVGRFRESAGVAGLRYFEVPPVEGINFTKAQAVRLAIFWSGR